MMYVIGVLLTAIGAFGAFWAVALRLIMGRWPPFTRVSTYLFAGGIPFLIVYVYTR